MFFWFFFVAFRWSNRPHLFSRNVKTPDAPEERSKPCLPWRRSSQSWVKVASWSINWISQKLTYCWWLKSCTSWYGEYPIIYRVLYIPGGAGFLPSTVAPARRPSQKETHLPTPVFEHGTRKNLLAGGFRAVVSKNMTSRGGHLFVISKDGTWKLEYEFPQNEVYWFPICGNYM